MDVISTQTFIEEETRQTVLPALMDFIRVPSTSPLYDSSWQSNGLLHQACSVLINWMVAQNITGLRYELIEDFGAPPLLYIEVTGSAADAPTALIYGHLDKQPGTQQAWFDFCGPTSPALKDNRLYGRGAADDGYSLTSIILAIKACQLQNQSHSRCVVVLDNEEESGSPHLLSYIEKIKAKIGTPSLVICLDSSVPAYDRLWVTDSLRGAVTFDLKVQALEKGVHSGGSGLIASSFRVLRELISRLEDKDTGRVKLEALHTSLDPSIYQKYSTVAQVVGLPWLDSFPLVTGVKPLHTDLVELLINQTWRPALTITGMEGLPNCTSAGNVLRPYTSVRVSLRLPPIVDAELAFRNVSETLTTNVPYNAAVTISKVGTANGWIMKPHPVWLEEACKAASTDFFGCQSLLCGGGGTIPPLSKLIAEYPQADYLVIGVLGPGSNAHSSNEALDIAYYQKVTCCLATLLHLHADSPT